MAQQTFEDYFQKHQQFAMQRLHQNGYVEISSTVVADRDPNMQYCCVSGYRLNNLGEIERKEVLFPMEGDIKTIA